MNKVLLNQMMKLGPLVYDLKNKAIVLFKRILLNSNCSDDTGICTITFPSLSGRYIWKGTTTSLGGLAEKGLI